MVSKKIQKRFKFVQKGEGLVFRKKRYWCGRKVEHVTEPHVL